MNITVKKSVIKGVAKAPPSKSSTHRAFIIASLANGTSTIEPIIESDDTLSTINACRALGAQIELKKHKAVVCGRILNKQNIKPRINCRMSGTTLRIITAVACVSRQTVVIDGAKRLRERPIKPLVEALRSLGAQIDYLSEEKYIPLKITPSKIHGHTVEIDAGESSQYVSAMMLIAPVTENGIKIKTIGAVASKTYIEITSQMMLQAGIHFTRDEYKTFKIPGKQQYKNKNIYLEGDYSSAFYMAAAAAITKGDVTIQNISQSSIHPDKRAFSLLEKMGVKIIRSNNQITVKGPKSLKPIRENMNDCPDSVPTFAAVASYAEGTSEFTGISHLKHKESDRLKETERVFKAIGVDITAKRDKLVIRGKTPQGGHTDSSGDHRLAMALTVAAMGSTNAVTIKKADVVEKSWPAFYDIMKKLGANITYVET